MDEMCCEVVDPQKQFLSLRIIGHFLPAKKNCQCFHFVTDCATNVQGLGYVDYDSNLSAVKILQFVNVDIVEATITLIDEVRVYA